MIIRKATNSDIEAIREINRQLGSGNFSYWLGRRWIEANILEGKYFVYNLSGDIFGAMCLDLPDSLDCLSELVTLSVKSSCHRKCIGISLVKKAFRISKEEGFKGVAVWSARKYSVEKFYYSMGFELTKKTPSNLKFVKLF